MGLPINSHGMVVPPIQPRTWSQFQSVLSLTGVQLLHLQQKKLTDSAVPSGSNTWLPWHHPSDFQVMSLECSLVAQMVKSLPAMLETRVRSLGKDDPLEKKMETHSSILAWKIPWTEEPGGLQAIELQKDGHN